MYASARGLTTFECTQPDARGTSVNHELLHAMAVALHATQHGRHNLRFLQQTCCAISAITSPSRPHSSLSQPHWLPYIILVFYHPRRQQTHTLLQSRTRASLNSSGMFWHAEVAI
jgi:hypothetical protein